MLWKRLEPERPVKFARSIVLRIDDDGKDPYGTTHSEDSTYGIGEQELAYSFTSHTLVACEPSDECRRYGIVTRQLPGDVLRQVSECHREGAERVEADNAEGLVDRDEDTRDVAFLILLRSPSKPIVEFRLAARKDRAVVFPERLDTERQQRSAEQVAMPP